jgi:transcriptional regulator with XRE-family HTH domain
LSFRASQTFEKWAIDERFAMCKLSAMDKHPITRFRESRKISQAAFAETVGCKRSMMNLIEKSVRRPSPQLAERIQTETGIDARLLLGISTSPVIVSVDEERAA